MKLLTLARDLRRRKSREKRARFVAEGIRSVEELLKSKIEIEGVLASGQLATAPRGEALLRDLRSRNVEILEVTDKEFATAAETDSPQGVLAIAGIPRWNLDVVAGSPRARLVVLDALQDPGNVGTIIRTAAALGATATLALPGTVDLWNAKVIRSSMGAQFTHTALAVTNEELADLVKNEGIELWGAEMQGEPLGETPAPEKLAIAVGNEGSGLSSTVRELATRTISLPSRSGIESLNVAVATGIILYELSK